MAAVLTDLEEGFCESDLPFKVDVVEWATTQKNFQRIIEQDSLVVQAVNVKSKNRIQTEEETLFRKFPGQ